MTKPSDAEAAIAGRMPAADTETVPLETACGRVLAAPARAERDQPPFDRVTMDGIAVRYDDLAAGRLELRVVGTIAAGMPPEPAPGPGECVEIMTGAVMPAGADTVVPVERICRDGEVARVAGDAEVAERQFVHPRGSDRRAGDVLIGPGTVIGAAETAVLASAGYAEVRVAKPARVAVVSTGDELVGLDEPVRPYQIRSSNDFAIEAALSRHGLASVARCRLPDDKSELIERIATLHAEHDALILSGGVSMGQFDFVPSVLEALSCEVVFHRIEQKPGRPMWFGISAAGKPVFALPGNPVSTLLCMARYVIPAFRRAAGVPTRPACRFPLADAVRSPRDLTYFVPVVLLTDKNGMTAASPRPTNTSGDFATLAGTDGFLELPPGRDEHPAGTVADFVPW